MGSDRLALRHLGYGIYWMWTMLCFQSTVAFLPFGSALDVLLASHSEFFVFSLVATVLAHPLWALYLARRPQACAHAPWASALVTTVSIALLGFAAGSAPWTLGALGVTSGVASAMLDVRWLQTLGGLTPERSGRAVCASICIAVLGYLAFTFVGRLTPVLCLVLLAVLPLASAGALEACCRAGEGLLKPVQVQRARRDARQIAGSLLWSVLGSLAFFFVLGCVQGIAAARADFNSLHALLLACEFVAVALMYVALRRRRRIEVSHLYALVMVLVSAGFLALPVVMQSQTQAGLLAATVLVNVGTMIIDVVVMCAITHAAFEWRTSGAIVGGMARGVTVGVMALGHIAGNALADSLWSGSVDVIMFVIVITYLLILCCSLYLSHVRGMKTSDELLYGTAAVSDAPAAQAEGTSAAPTGEGKGAADTSDAPATEQEPAPDPYDRRIEAVALAHHLSRRETDVFALIARGRSVPFIAEALVISENTVRSHARRIYDKLGVHSKQELLNMVEGEQ